jgi:dCMP deaminase
MYITHSPCLDCAKLIHQSGIKKVFFSDAYRDEAGLTFLEKSGIIVEQIK